MVHEFTPLDHSRVKFSGRSRSPFSGKEARTNLPHAISPAHPKNVEIVNLRRCQDGQGVGFVDGRDTAVESDGLYIRFIIPRNTFEEVKCVNGVPILLT